jgi:hypothetical protein
MKKISSLSPFKTRTTMSSWRDRWKITAVFPTPKSPTKTNWHNPGPFAKPHKNRAKITMKE